MTARQITVDVDDDQLQSYSDSYLAGLWHVAQLNPAPIEDDGAAQLVAKLQWEIVRRFLRQTAPELYHHQQHHPHWWALTRMASYVDGRWVPDPEKIEKLNGAGAGE